MQRNAKAVVILLFVSVAAGFLYNLHKSRNASVIRTVTQEATASNTTEARPAPQIPILREMVPKTRFVTPAKGDGFRPEYSPFDNPASAAAEALPATKAGSAKAMFQLSQAYRKCVSADPGTDEEIERKVANQSLGREGMAKAEGKPADRAQLIAAAAEEVKRRKVIRDECKTLPASEVKSWRGWLEKSAELGDSRARIDLARAVFDDFRDEQSRLEKFDEYGARRTKAFDLLEDSVANGECSNEILNAFSPLHQDSVQSYIYESLLLKHALADFANDTTSPAGYVQEQQFAIKATLQNQLSSLPADQRTVADDTSNYILKNYCRTF